MQDKKELGRRLERSRRLAGVTVADMANTLGCSETTIRNYTKGRIVPRPSYITQWAEKTGADERWLLDGLYGDI